MMRAAGFCVNEKRLRERLRDGTYKEFPELERRREGRIITLSRKQVEEWIADRAAKAAAAAMPAPRRDRQAFARSRELLAQQGNAKTLRALERLERI